MTEREQGANFLPVSGSISFAFSSNIWFLPKEISSPSLLFLMETGLTASWTTCCRSLSPSSDSTAHQEQWPETPGLRFPREIPQTAAKRPVESKWKSHSSTHRLKLTTVGSMWLLDFFFPHQGVYTFRIKGQKLLITSGIHCCSCTNNNLRCWLPLYEAVTPNHLFLLPCIPDQTLHQLCAITNSSPSPLKDVSMGIGSSSLCPFKYCQYDIFSSLRFSHWGIHLFFTTHYHFSSTAGDA